MAVKDYYTKNTSANGSRMHSIYRMLDAQPDLVQTDMQSIYRVLDTQPDLVDTDMDSVYRVLGVQTELTDTDVYAIYRMSDAQPDWAETDPSQPDYIKNKESVERFRPVSVNGEEILDDSYQSGNLNFVSGENIDISVENGSIKISAKGSNVPDVPDSPQQDTDTVRPIYVNGEKILSEATESGELNLVGGKNVTLAVEGNMVVISASGGGSPEGGGDCPEFVEGQGIDITENIYGQREISIENESISDDMIKSVSIEKITYNGGETLILYGGNANGID